jgi:hypothetical protein
VPVDVIVVLVVVVEATEQEGGGGIAVMVIVQTFNQVRLGVTCLNVFTLARGDPTFVPPCPFVCSFSLFWSERKLQSTKFDLTLDQQVRQS